jgi:dUTP pyrophosphatase
MFNLGLADYTIEKGDRIAQLVVARYEAIAWEESDLSSTDRGAGGFGSSGR